MDWINTITRLCACDAPSGFESRIAPLAEELLRPYADEISYDALGNIMAVKRCGKPGAARVLLDAHIDEIGFVMTGYAENGFLRFTGIGGHDERLLPASDIKILAEPPVYGVIDTLPPHLVKDGESDDTVKIDDLYIDAGLSPEGARERMPVGTPAVFVSETVLLGERQISAKALDNRASVAVIIGALELLGDAPLSADLHILLSSQEEVGTRGAPTAAYAADAAFGIILDVDFARQAEILPEKGRPLGVGVVIARGPNMDRELVDRAEAIARERGIPYQITVEPGGNSGTNARPVQVSRAGVKTALLGVPVKYMHTPVETADLRDFDAAARLVCELIKECGDNA
ncbi:MAG: M20/M25/M40 family metallo-hydrolase [Oscillospiraceae bacterium]|jgi:endoglucanase|nr:M20/M25/M40 family metallo-hydrolase [Oscillospiraceae bacterium]